LLDNPKIIERLGLLSQPLFLLNMFKFSLIRVIGRILMSLNKRLKRENK